jgi:hypothetical protein
VDPHLEHVGGVVPLHAVSIKSSGSGKSGYHAEGDTGIPLGPFAGGAEMPFPVTSPLHPRAVPSEFLP